MKMIIVSSNPVYTNVVKRLAASLRPTNLHTKDKLNAEAVQSIEPDYF